MTINNTVSGVGNPESGGGSAREGAKAGGRRVSATLREIIVLRMEELFSGLDDISA